jgi:hypothetical protein
MSNDMWFNNPGVLLNNPDQFIPINKLSITEKVNALARFGIYTAIIIWVLDKEQKWYYLSAGVIIFSYLMGKQNNMEHLTQYTNYKYLDPKFNYESPIKNIYGQINNSFSLNNGKNNSKYLETTKPYNNWDNRINDRTNFESWCYNDNLINNYNPSSNQKVSPSNQILSSPSNQVETNDNSKNIDIYYDKNKINNLANDKLTINLHLV